MAFQVHSSRRALMALKTLGAIALFALVFFIGAYVGQATFEPQTITVVKHSTKVEYQPVESTVVEYKYIETPVVLRNFDSLDELEQWLNDTNVTAIRFQSPDTKIDCDDYALELQQKAMSDGYIMSFEVIHPGEYNKLFETRQLPPNSLHAINSVVIGNNVYYIEPQTRETVFVAPLDWGARLK